MKTNFQRWFGDSKVVNEKGEPLVMYHGTAANIQCFRMLDGELGRGAYFTTDTKFASDYAGDVPGSAVYPVFVRVDNPAPFPEIMALLDAAISSDEITKELIRRGYDGIVDRYAGQVMVVAFYPEQIKSATGNSGAFDSASPDICDEQSALRARIDRSKAPSAEEEFFP